MVPVLLKDMVLVPHTRSLWPAEFDELVAACERVTLLRLSPAATNGTPVPDAGPEDERTPFALVADWVQEHAAEPDFEAAWRWLVRRPKVRIRNSAPPHEWSYPHLHGHPQSLGYEAVAAPFGTGLAGLVAALADRLAERRKELE